MGIKTIIKNSELPKAYQNYTLIKTKDGNSDTVYFMDDKYVLKVFENKTIQTIQNELYVLELCKNLPVPKLYSEVFYIDDKPAIVYEKCDGKSLKISKIEHIKQIAIFLKKFHRTTKDKSLNGIEYYSEDYLLSLIKKTKNNKFQDIYNSINIKLKHDGIIHGDIFYDNAIFKDDKLKCIIDFTESCNGDFIFDLAVVAIIWCFEEDNLDSEKLEVLCETYELNISMVKFKEYMKYALLYYITTRDLDNRDYDDLLKKMDNINEKY